MQIKNVSFQNKQDKTLAGILHIPENPRGCALFAHCFSCSKDLHASRAIAQGLAERGIAVLRFDFTGLGESAPSKTLANFSVHLDDLESAGEFLKSQNLPVDILVGHSLGGAAVLHAAEAFQDLKAICTLGAPASPTHVTHLFDSKRLEAEGDLDVTLAGRKFSLRGDFLDAVKQHQGPEHLKTLDVPALILHSQRDEIVPYAEALELQKALGAHTSLMNLGNADHLLSSSEDARYAADLIATFAHRRLPSPTVDRKREADVIVESVEGTPFLTEVRAGPNTLIADEPQKIGGDDAGLSPFELLYASLGACTTMTLHMYARRKKWPLSSVRVELVAETIDAKNSEEHRDHEGKVLQIQRNIFARGDLDDDARSRLLEIANKCPVHKAMHNPIEVLSFLSAE